MMCLAITRNDPCGLRILAGSLTSSRCFPGAESPGWKGEMSQSLSFQIGSFSGCCCQLQTQEAAEEKPTMGPRGGWPASSTLSCWRTWTRPVNPGTMPSSSPWLISDLRGERWEGTSPGAFVWCLRVWCGAWGWELRWSWQKRHN